MPVARSLSESLPSNKLSGIPTLAPVEEGRMVEYNPLCSASVWLATTWCCASTSTVLWLLEKCETMTPVAHLSLIQARRLALRSLAPEFQSHPVPEVVRR